VRLSSIVWTYTYFLTTT